LPEGWSACRPPARRYFIENITIHPSFRLKPRNRRPDIALIRLAHPVNFSGMYNFVLSFKICYNNLQIFAASEIIPACLPLGNFQFINLESDEGKNNLITMGWGSDLRGIKICCF